MTVSANLITSSLYVAENKTFWHELGSCLGGGGEGGRDMLYKHNLVHDNFISPTKHSPSPSSPFVFLSIFPPFLRYSLHLSLLYSDGLVLLSLLVNHDVCLIQHKHCDLLRINDSLLQYPV